MSGSTTEFNYTGSETVYTIVTSGTYEVTAIGGTGGGAADAAGGAGAEVQGYFTLAQGTQIEMYVGSKGGDAGPNSDAGGGGGGGTFVYFNSYDPTEVAGGGGGAGYGTPGGPGQSGTLGQAGGSTDLGTGGSPATGVPSNYEYGGGGNGGANPNYGEAGFNSEGGYGGGGDGGTEYSTGFEDERYHDGGGGGGGYIGGGGGAYSVYSDGGGGGGGGSYENADGTHQAIFAGENSSGNGSVSFLLLNAGITVPGGKITTGSTELISNGTTVSSPIIAGGVLELGLGSSLSGTISFSSIGGELIVDSPTDIPTETITGFAPGDTIQLDGVFYDPVNDFVTVGTAGIVTIDASGTIYQLNIAGAYVGETNFQLSNDLLLTENFTTVQTLNPGTPSVTFSSTDTIIAYGPAGILSVNSAPIFTAVYGPVGTHFTIQNDGLIETQGTNASNSLDVGIALGSTGTLFDTGTIFGGSGIGILGSVGSSYIDNSGYVNGSVGVGLYLQGAGTAVNSGNIYGAQTGVELSGGGFVTNTGGGIISGTAQYAVDLNARGSLSNQGLVWGWYGVVLNAGGSVNNSGTIQSTNGNTSFGDWHGAIRLSESGSVDNSGLILSNQFGIVGVYAPISITNSGSIGTDGTFDFRGTVEASAGIGLLDGGSITDTSAGLISGQDGISIEGSAGSSGSISNAGLISGTHAGIYSNVYTSVNNSGTIEGTGGEFINVSTVSFGTFTSTFSSGSVSTGIYLHNAGNITNTANGLITGYNGIDIGINVPSFTAASTINNAGTILGTDFGVVITGAAASVTNSGLIQATAGNFIDPFGEAGDGTGIALFDGGAITNQAGGIITGYEGILADGRFTLSGTSSSSIGAITLVNRGIITGTGSMLAGVELGGSAIVTNSSSATISGGEWGVDAYTTLGPVNILNSGTIIANNTQASFNVNYGGDPAGINFGPLGSVTNTGLIESSDFGVSGGKSIFNSGTIDGTGGTFTLIQTLPIESGGSFSFETIAQTEVSTGVFLTSGETVTNTSTGRISGVDGIVTEGSSGSSAYIFNAGTIIATGDGLLASNTATINNSGVILAQNSSAIYLESGGLVINTGKINAAYGIVGIQTNPVTVINDGAIETTGTTACAIYLTAGGTVTNNAFGTMNAYYAAVYIKGTAGAFVTNSGSLNGYGEKFIPGSLAGVGIDLYSSVKNVLTNTSTGRITGLHDGIVIENASGTITNAGSIIGADAGIAATAFTSINNSGLIEATDTTLVTFSGLTFAGIGVDLAAGGAVTNQFNGTISGEELGILTESSLGVAATIDNSGLVEALGTQFISGGQTIDPGGVTLLDGGTLTNEATGRIFSFDGVFLTSGTTGNSSYLDNFGSITGTGLTGVVLGTSASMSNSGQINGAHYGVILLDGNIITNQSSGTITGGVEGVLLADGGEVINKSGGTIIGTDIGIDGNSFATNIDNSGLIEATASTLVTLGGFTFPGTAIDLTAGSDVTNQSDGIISGQIGAAFSGGGTLTNAGTITGLGGTAVYFGTVGSGEIIIDPGAIFNGTVYDAAGNGVLDLASATTHGTLAGIGSAFIGFSQITIDAKADWTLAGTNSISAGQTLSDYGTLVVDGAFINNGLIETDPSTITFTGDITGTGEIIVGTDSVIVFDGSVSSGETIVFVDTTGTVFVNDPVGFHGAITGAAGTVVYACFAAGTHILTPQGDVAVENLAVGDLVITHDGEDAAIQWIGRRTLDLTRHPQPEKAQPIRIAAGALGDNTPSRDLLLSPDHALYLSGHLVPVKALRNFSNITQLNRRSVTYYHIELENHSVIFAEAAPVETYLETGNRHAFENGGAAMMLHPDFAQTDYQAMREAEGCAPFAEHGPVVDGIRRSILQRVYAYRTG